MLRFARETDVPQMLAIYAPYVLTTTCSFEYEVPTPLDFFRRFQDYTRQFPWLVWEEGGKVLGYAYGSAPFGERAAYRWCAEASIYLRPEAQGRGIGRRLYTALEKILTLQGYQVLYALVTSENIPSQRFHTALGYRLRADFPRCGFKFGRWLGVFWYEKPLGFVEFPSAAPTHWQGIVTDVQKLFQDLDNLSIS